MGYVAWINNTGKAVIDPTKPFWNANCPQLDQNVFHVLGAAVKKTGNPFTDFYQIDMVSPDRVRIKPLEREARTVEAPDAWRQLYHTLLPPDVPYYSDVIGREVPVEKDFVAAIERAYQGA